MIALAHVVGSTGIERHRHVDMRISETLLCCCASAPPCYHLPFHSMVPTSFTLRFALYYNTNSSQNGGIFLGHGACSYVPGH